MSMKFLVLRDIVLENYNLDLLFDTQIQALSGIPSVTEVQLPNNILLVMQCWSIPAQSHIGKSNQCRSRIAGPRITSSWASRPCNSVPRLSHYEY
jgi:hypothetical protein